MSPFPDAQIEHSEEEEGELEDEISRQGLPRWPVQQIQTKSVHIAPNVMSTLNNLKNMLGKAQKQLGTK